MLSGFITSNLYDSSLINFLNNYKKIISILKTYF